MKKNNQRIPSLIIPKTATPKEARRLAQEFAKSVKNKTPLQNFKENYWILEETMKNIKKARK